MELVYLWVEKYKNIHRQGFNFSPRFECRFHDEYEKYTDEDGKEKERLKDDCKLEICDKKKKECKDNDYIENFFGDNINVTAIVGKNGSGKSSVLEALEMFTDINYLIRKGDIVNRTPFLLLLFNEIEGFYYIKNKITINKRDKQDYKLKRAYDFNKAKIISNSVTETNNNLFFNLTFSYADHFKTLQKMGNEKFKFSTLVLTLKHNYFSNNQIKNIISAPQELVKLGMKDIDEPLKSKIKALNKLTHSTFQDALKYNYLFYYISKVIEVMNDRCVAAEFAKQSLYNNLDNIVNLDDITIDIINEYINNFFEESMHGCQNSQDREEFISTYFGEYKKNIKFLEKINFKKIDHKYVATFPLNEKDKIQKTLQYLYKFDFLKIELADKVNKIYYSDLSDGEKNILKVIMAVLSKIKAKEHIILFDEPDNYMHPIWKRELPNNIFDAIKLTKTDKIVHIVFTTHSPFLLSDIPKQNIIFLDTYQKEDDEVKAGKQKVGNCRVLSHDEVFAKKQTFGANIHTLLSDSFFMKKDGLMGEFAKGKINEIIKFLRNKSHDDKAENLVDINNHGWLHDREKLLNVIKMIGEPFLRSKVLELYYDKYADERTKEQRKRELEAQKAQIERELSQL